MTLIDHLVALHNGIAFNGRRRPIGWQMDERALTMLEEEHKSAATNTVLGYASPRTFLGLPIEIGNFAIPMIEQGHASDRFAPCLRADRGTDREWDIFDLDECKPEGEVHRTKHDAEVKCKVENKALQAL